MMVIKYQIILIGAKNPFIEEILAVLFRHIRELGLNTESISVIKENNFRQAYRKNAPMFCLYFGDNGGDFKNIDLLDGLLKDAALILPVVADLEQFNQAIPKQLANINGFKLASANEVENLVSCILEGLSLLRLSRRLFISYKRNESSTVAMQLFEQLEKQGFDVFLDTHSIRPGEPFQEELWHRMADTDVVVLLNTPGFLQSEWTTEELAKANSMSIGILQLIWPTHNLEREAQISLPYQLTCDDFGNALFNGQKSYLTDATVAQVAAKAESLRARNLASRQFNIINEFIASAKNIGKKVDLQPEKFITVSHHGGKELIVIPTVGVPQAFTYHQSEELVKRIKAHQVTDIYLLYDHRNIRKTWLEHLAWLDNYLPIKTVKIVEAEQWLKNI